MQCSVNIKDANIGDQGIWVCKVCPVHPAPSFSTDLHCYFQCSETFKRDYDLRQHPRGRHQNEPPLEYRNALQALEDEVYFVNSKLEKNKIVKMEDFMKSERTENESLSIVTCDGVYWGKTDQNKKWWSSAIVSDE